jgi:membrane protein DedA with SNARE-associated domain
MGETLQFLIGYGYLVIFGWVFLEQVGLPLPAIPVLFAAGALAGAGRLSLPLALALAVVAALAGDLIWYEIGRRKGGRVLNFLCRISLEPDSCVRNTEAVFARHGARSLLVAKFLPGLGTAAPPLAGIFRMRLPRFLLFDGLGAVLWAGAFVVLGYLFSGHLERMATTAGRLGAWVLVLLVGALGAYVLGKYIRRRRFIRKLRVARITPEELREKQEAGEAIVVVDLRHSLDFEAEPQVIPGAVRMDTEELADRHHEIPRDREVVLYCT